MAESDKIPPVEARAAGWLASERRQRWIAAIIIGIGVMFRLVAYLHNRSLWLDEAMLSCSIIRRSFAGLLEPTLDFNQAAPVGFLYLSNLATMLFGPSEYALRLVSLLAGLAALPLFYVLIRRYVGGGTALIGLALFAVSEGLIYHSHEAKQYSLDVLVTLLLLHAVEPVLRDEPRPRHWVILGVAGALAIWFSHPAIFVLGGVGVALAGSSLYEKNWKELAIASIVGVVWLSSFGLNYLLLTSRLAANPKKLTAFDYTFMPLSFTLETLEWLRHALTGLAERALRLPTDVGCAFVATVCLVIGVVRLFARNRVRGMLLMGPILFALVASALQKYPFRGRLLLFLVPMIVICVALGMQWFLASARYRAVRIFGLLLLAVLLLVPLGPAAHNMFTGYADQEMRPVLQYVLEHKRPGDRIFLYESAFPAFIYYCEAYEYEPGEYMHSHELAEDPAPYRSPEAWLMHEKGPRIWVMFSHEDGYHREQMLAELDKVATRVDTHEVGRAGAYLYRLNEPSGNGEGGAEAP
jgi:uncharacterized membrane protein